MYSKCMVEPLMRTPIAMTASKGPFEASDAETVDDTKPVAPRRSLAVDDAWTFDPEIILKCYSGVSRRG